MSCRVKFKKIQITPDGETTKTKIVDLEELWNFVVDNIFYMKSSIQRKLLLNFSHLKFKIFDDLRWRNDQN
jgi:hypothetical protein